jgi:hypothetical protein
LRSWIDSPVTGVALLLLCATTGNAKAARAALHRTALETLILIRFFMEFSCLPGFY